MTTLIFDLDETLVHEHASVRETFHATCLIAEEQVGVDATALSQTVQERARELWYDVCPVRPYCVNIGISFWEGLSGTFSGDDLRLAKLRAWIPAYRQEAWTRALSAYGIQDEALVEELIQSFRVERGKRHVVYPETYAVLSVLHDRFSLAMITNGASEVQREKLNAPGLAVYFDLVIVSGEIGVGKPSPEVYQHTLEKLGIDGNEAIMIGDNPINDVQGAQRAGMRGVWVNRTDSPCPDGVVPDGIISDLTPLLSADWQG